MTDYKLSFVLPTKDREEWMGECVQSLLSQTAKDIELVVVNDGSTDGTKEFLDGWLSKFSNVQIAHNPTPLGAGASRNIGMSLARAPIIGVCDDDDIYPNERAELILEHFEKNPTSELVNFPYIQIGYYNEKLKEFDGEPFNYDLFQQTGAVNYFCNPAAAFKKEAALEVGGYPNEKASETDDIQFIRNWVAAGKKIDFQPGFYLCYHRVLPTSMMATMRGWKREWTEAQ